MPSSKCALTQAVCDARFQVRRAVRQLALALELALNLTTIWDACESATVSLHVLVVQTNITDVTTFRDSFATNERVKRRLLTTFYTSSPVSSVGWRWPFICSSLAASLSCESKGRTGTVLPAARGQHLCHEQSILLDDAVPFLPASHPSPQPLRLRTLTEPGRL